jgi:hypothetical protein
MDRDSVFIVQGAILNMYGKSGGVNGANGTMGYGAPWGDEFLYEGGIAQRFDHGLIRVNPAGRGIFIPEENTDPEEIPEGTGAFPGDTGAIRQEFQSAWQRGMGRYLPFLTPDDAVQALNFSETPWRITADSGDIYIRELYYQTFNQGSVLFILGISPDVVFRTRILVEPFLNALLAGGDQHLPGTDTSVSSKPALGSSSGFTKRLIQGLTLYGLPVTDAFPREEEGSLREVQRFSLGWMEVRR